MEKFDTSEGKWRTVGGRRIFIREGQSLSDAMKGSGKFKSKNQKDREAKEKEIKEAKKTLAQSYNTEELKEEIEHYNSMIKEMERRLNKKDLSGEKREEYENRAAQYEARRDELQQQTEHNKEKDSSNKYKDLYDKEDYDKIISHLSESEKQELQDTRDSLMYYPKGSEKYNRTYQKGLDLERKAADRYFESKSSDSKRGSDNSDSAGKAMVFDRNDETFKYKGSYPDDSMRFANESSKQIESLGTHVLNEYQSGNMSYEEAKKALNTGVSGVKGVSAGEGFYHIGNNVNMKDTLYNTAAQKKLINQMNYYTNKLEENKSNSGNSNSNAYKKAFEDYKKKHPNSKLTLQKFIDMSEGK